MNTDEAIAWLARNGSSPHGSPLIQVETDSVAVYRDWRAFEDGNAMATGKTITDAVDAIRSERRDQAYILSHPEPKQTDCGELRVQDCVCGNCEVLS